MDWNDLLHKNLSLIYLWQDSVQTNIRNAWKLTWIICRIFICCTYIVSKIKKLHKSLIYRAYNFQLRSGREKWIIPYPVLNTHKCQNITILPLYFLILSNHNSTLNERCASLFAHPKSRIFSDKCWSIEIREGYIEYLPNH